MTTDESTRDHIQSLCIAQLCYATVRSEVKSEGIWLDITFDGLSDYLLIVPWNIARQDDNFLTYWIRDKMLNRLSYLVRHKYMK